MVVKEWVGVVYLCLVVRLLFGVSVVWNYVMDFVGGLDVTVEVRAALDEVMARTRAVDVWFFVIRGAQLFIDVLDGVVWVVGAALILMVMIVVVDGLDWWNAVSAVVVNLIIEVFNNSMLIFDL